MRAALILVVLTVAACGRSIEQYPCPPGGTTLTYAELAGFFDVWCQRCHGSASTDRHGAPGDFIFDTVEQIRRHRARIFVRAAAENDTMPPGPDNPPLSARNQLAEWLACGAP
jgi:uncharacterized membrane protein